MDELLVDRKYRLLLFQYLDKKPEFTGTPYKPKWQLECPICGAKKSTLVWMPDRQTYKFFCSKSNRLACGSACEFRCFSRFGINRSGWRTWVNGRNQAPLVLDGMFEGVVVEPNAASTQKERVSQSPSPQPTQKWVSTRCWAVLLMVLLG